MRRRRPGRGRPFRGVLRPRRISEAPLNVILVQPQLGVTRDTANLVRIEALLDAQRLSFSADDILVLPEHVDMRLERRDYEESMRELARRYGCHVIGGSHHEVPGDTQSTQAGALSSGALNTGVVVRPDGAIVARYDKLRPYAAERDRVRPGTRLGEVEIGGRNILILVCADFWFSDVFERAAELPDLVLVPALSVTRKATPDYSRALWRHLAIARAYEFGVYIGISDWAYPSGLPALFTSGVGGFADPTQTDPAQFFTPIPESGVGVFAVNFDALDHFRRDRRIRGFFWKEP